MRLVKRQPASRARNFLFAEVRRLQILRRPFYRLLVVAVLSAGSSQGINHIWVLPLCEEAGFVCVFHGQLPIASTGVRAGGENPGQAVVGVRVFWIELDGLFVVGDGLVKVTF